MLNDSDLQKAAEEMLNDAHEDVRNFSAIFSRVKITALDSKVDYFFVIVLEL